MAGRSTSRLPETLKAAYQKGVCGHDRLGGVGFPIVMVKFKLLRDYTFFHNEF